MATSPRPRSRPLTAWDRRCIRSALAGYLRENPPPRRPDPPPDDGLPPRSQLYDRSARSRLADPFGD
jgi:hypothetical protein